MLRLTIISVLIMSCGIGFAQQQSFCGHNGKLVKYSIPKPSDKVTEIAPKSGDPYIIPVVFHVLHLNGSENISDQQIMDAMKALNEDFNKQNEDTILVISEYADKISNIGVQFKLAKLDPQGDPTTGINRIYTTLTNHGWDDSSKINQWPQNQYLNIWICKTLEGHAAAYSWYPAYAEDYPELDGIMVEHTYLGYSGTASEVTRHVLTHEVGHFLNLMHTWDVSIPGTICGDDEVEDTPITKSSGCDLYLSDCNPPIIENVQNFMTGSYCFMMYTEGQKTRMINCLNSSEGLRKNLWQTDNLIATGLGEFALTTSNLNIIQWSVYPNPAGTELFIQLVTPLNGPVDLNITDLSGKILLRHHFDTSGLLEKIDISAIPSGIYMVDYNLQNQKTVSKIAVFK